MTIALDAMGGDFGPSVVVPAALTALNKWPNLHLILVGNEASIQAELNQHKTRLRQDVKARFEILATTEVVAMDEPPAVALRTKKNSSMRVAINLVKDKRAKACVSAGNTGALMATARFVLKTLPGIDRPAILSFIPTRIATKPVRVLDLGANVDCSAQDLFQFAVMGMVVSQTVDARPLPKVALLNIGAEAIKGNEQVKATQKLLEQAQGINFVGYVEGNDIFSGDVDVIVCDGFVGNVALKTSEGVAKLIATFIKEAFTRNLWSRIAACFAMPVLKSLRKRIDPARYNGACLVGLGGIVIKSHGGASVVAYTAAIGEAIRQVESDIVMKIASTLDTLLVNKPMQPQEEAHGL